MFETVFVLVRVAPKPPTVMKETQAKLPGWQFIILRHKGQHNTKQNKFVRLKVTQVGDFQLTFQPTCNGP